MTSIRAGDMDTGNQCPEVCGFLMAYNLAIGFLDIPEFLLSWLYDRF